MKKILFLAIMMIGTIGYGYSLSNVRDSIVQDTILIREGKITKALLQTKYVSYRLLQEIKTDVHLSEAQIKELVRYGFTKVNSSNYERFIILPLPVVKEKITKQEIFYYLNKKNELISERTFSPIKESIEWGATVLSIILPLILIMLIGFLSGRSKNIRPALLFCSAQIIFVLLSALVVQYTSQPADAFRLAAAMILMILVGFFGFKISFGAAACCLMAVTLVGFSTINLSTSLWPYLLIVTAGCLISLAIALITKRRLLRKNR